MLPLKGEIKKRKIAHFKSYQNFIIWIFNLVVYPFVLGWKDANIDCYITYEKHIHSDL